MTKENLKPNKMILDMVFETSLRINNSDRIAEVLEQYIDQNKEPANYLLNKIS